MVMEYHRTGILLRFFLYTHITHITNILQKTQSINQAPKNYKITVQKNQKHKKIPKAD